MTATATANLSPEEARARIKAAIRSYRRDPALFARKVLGINPTAQQQEFLRELTKEGAHVAIRSGHGTGKSKSLAIAALWFMCLFPNALVACTAPTAHQLEDVLWREIRQCVDGMASYWKSRITISADKVTLANSSAMIVARTARPEKPDALQGFHAEHILFIIDEAAGVADAVFEVARGALSTPGAKVVMTGNPTRLNGYFHSAFHVARETWTRLQFSCLDSPLVGKSYAEEIAREYGEDSDVYRVRVLGDFPKSGLMAVIPLDLVDAAMGRSLPANHILTAPKILGGDLSLEGGDRTVLVMRQGTYARVLHTARGLVTSQLVTLIANCINKEKPDAVFLDKGGLGAPIIHNLIDLGFSVVKGVNFGEGANDKDRFIRRREEMWWLMREWLETYDPVIDYHAELRDDLIAPEYQVTMANKIQLESKDTMKKRGLASPDHADALALTFAMPVAPKAALRPQLRSRQRDHDPFAFYGRRGQP